MFGTTKPCAVAIAIPMLWDPRKLNTSCHQLHRSWSKQEQKSRTQRFHTFQHNFIGFLNERAVQHRIFTQGHRKWLYEERKESVHDSVIFVLILKSGLQLHKRITIYFLQIMKMWNFCSQAHWFDHCSLVSPAESKAQLKITTEWPWMWSTILK